MSRTTRGYVSTVATDGQPLTIIYIHRTPEESRFRAEVRVLEEFAAALNRGDLDVKGKSPFKDTQPCEQIIVTASDHISTNSADESAHLTVDVASASSWAAGYAKSGVHVYFVNDKLDEGYSGWKKPKKKDNSYKGPKVQRDMQQALSIDLTSMAGSASSQQYYHPG